MTSIPTGQTGGQCHPLCTVAADTGYRGGAVSHPAGSAASAPHRWLRRRCPKAPACLISDILSVGAGPRTRVANQRRTSCTEAGFPGVQRRGRRGGCARVPSSHFQRTLIPTAESPARGEGGSIPVWAGHWRPRLRGPPHQLFTAPLAGARALLPAPRGARSTFQGLSPPLGLPAPRQRPRAPHICPVGHIPRP